MTKMKVLSASVAAAVTVMLAFSLVPASSQQPPAGTQQFELVEFSDKAREIFLDVNQRNDFGPGDRLAVKNALFDSADTSNRVGKYTLDIAFMPPRRCDCFTFNGAVKLADGNLSVSGFGTARDFETGFEAPIVGGTGNLASAHGTVTLTEEEIDGKNAVRWVFDFVVPAS